MKFQVSLGTDGPKQSYVFRNVVGRGGLNGRGREETSWTPCLQRQKNKVARSAKIAAGDLSNCLDLAHAFCAAVLCASVAAIFAPTRAIPTLGPARLPHGPSSKCCCGLRKCGGLLMGARVPPSPRFFRNRIANAKTSACLARQRERQVQLHP